jgi:hypothetical protein
VRQLFVDKSENRTGLAQIKNEQAPVLPTVGEVSTELRVLTRSSALCSVELWQMQSKWRLQRLPVCVIGL